jgi:hypothetical protein
MGMANQAFMGVTDMGLQGGKRSNALDFITQNYVGMGMSISDSLALVSQSVKTGTANLQQLAGVLDNVTNSAQSAGINTDAARQSFSSMFQSATSVGGMNATQGAIYASARQNMFSQLGQAGVGLTATPAPVGLLAAEAGLTPGQASARSMGPGAATWIGNQQQKAISQIASGPNAVYSSQQLAQAAQGHGLSQFMSQMPGGRDEMISVLSSAAIGMNASQLSQLDNGPLTQLYAQQTRPGALNVGISTANAVSSINSAINANRPKDSTWGLGATWTMGLHNHQLTGATTNIDNYINKHGSGDKNVSIINSLVSKGLDARVYGTDYGGQGGVPGQPAGSETVQAALGDPRTFKALMEGHGTINGQSFSKWIAAHKTSLHPSSATATNQNGKGSNTTGTVSIGLTPSAASIFQIAQSSGNVNTPPVGASPFPGGN